MSHNQFMDSAMNHPRVIPYCLVMFFSLALSGGAQAADAEPAIPMAEVQELISAQTQLLDKINKAQAAALQSAISDAAAGQPSRLPVPAAGAKNDRKKDAAVRVEGPAICNVEVGKYDMVDIHAQNVLLSTMLQELAVKSRRNIILAAGADRPVAVTLYSVPFRDALTVLLDVNGLGFVEENEFIQVFTKEQMRERSLGKNGMESRFIRLNYMRAKDAAEAVKTLLSPVGKVGVVKDEDDVQTKDSGSGMEDSKKKQDGVFTPEKQNYVFAAGVTVYDYRDNVEAIASLLAQLDQRPRQVLVEATILTIKLNDNNALGVDFSLLSRTSGLKFFDMGDSGLPVKGDSFRGGIISNDADVNGKPTSFRGGFAIENVGMFVSALNQISDVSVVARPKVLTLDRQRAKVLIGQNTGYTENTMQNGTVVQSIKFLETGISLDVRSYILEDGKIRLTAYPKISDVAFTEQAMAGGIVQKVPTENVQSLAVDILLQPGNTAVIGGLFVEQVKAGSSQVPGVGDLPVIGHAARRRTDESHRQELVFLLTPTIVCDQELDDIGQATAARTDKMLSGERQGLLPWSRVRHGEQLQLRARRFLANQQNGLGEWTYRRSLQFDGDCCPELEPPVQPSVSTHGVLEKEIRDQIGGTRVSGSWVAPGTATPLPEFSDQIVMPAGAGVIAVDETPMPELRD